MPLDNRQQILNRFSSDRANGRAYATVSCPSVCRL